MFWITLVTASTSTRKRRRKFAETGENGCRSGSGTGKKRSGNRVVSIELEVIQQKIFEIRGQRVMLDADLAELYGVETGALVRAVIPANGNIFRTRSVFLP